MKRSLLISTAVAVLLPMASADAQWVFVARKAAQRIHHMTEGGVGGQPGYDFASVVLEAPADKVFAVALDRAQKNRAVHLLMSDPGARRLQVAEGDRTATLNVVELSEGVSQLLIAGRSRPGEQAASSQVVAAVMRVCAELKKTCELAR
ncbi:MAG: hypothetical protein JSS04_27900 [Proteobacteria bacterium]|nr:hypothetical protein [Pseudomonadota bacterium]